MGFSCHQTHLKNIKYRLTNFRDFFIQLNLSRIAFDNQKLQQTIEKILRYFCMDLLVIKTHLKKYQISINKFSRFSIIQLNLSRIAFDNQKLQQTIEKILRYFCMGFSWHQNPSKKYPMSINQIFEIFFYSVELIANCIRQSKTTTNYWKDLRYFCMGFTVIKTHLKISKYRLTNFSRFYFIQLNLSRIAFDNQNYNKLLKRFWDIFAWDLLVIKTHLKNIKYRLSNFEIFFYSVELIANCIRQIKNYNKLLKRFWDIFAWI